MLHPIRFKLTMSPSSDTSPLDLSFPLLPSTSSSSPPWPLSRPRPLVSSFCRWFRYVLEWGDRFRSVGFFFPLTVGSDCLDLLLWIGPLRCSPRLPRLVRPNQGIHHEQAAYQWLWWHGKARDFDFGSTSADVHFGSAERL